MPCIASPALTINQSLHIDDSLEVARSYDRPLISFLFYFLSRWGRGGYLLYLFLFFIPFPRAFFRQFVLTILAFAILSFHSFTFTFGVPFFFSSHFAVYTFSLSLLIGDIGDIGNWNWNWATQKRAGRRHVCPGVGDICH
ncbi:unnamed protein product [Tuber melanosporum]|uniref:(Perigord truffle) hypothetical protein n=1 Tax=Tuber melanosporum (strain Mel28) TaxID=656061 RepID=D5GB12_TUBMM|nr:uncharacterized protein GSTUM_00005396001 [Tuber melanosporum]CAZ81705.1 unnamed protein product [Tuber melanosporum]